MLLVPHVNAAEQDQHWLACMSSAATQHAHVKEKAGVTVTMKGIGEGAVKGQEATGEGLKR